MFSNAFHGGADSLGRAQFDFSTNANTCGPCPLIMADLAQADCVHYPDPNYTSLRLKLAQWHAVDSRRVLFAASASEFIFRITSWAQRSGCQQVWLPQHSYGDYARAALACGLQSVVCDDNMPEVALSSNLLQWHCDPSSPLGQHDSRWSLANRGVVTVVDLAYAPLKLGPVRRETGNLDHVWQLWTPNKSLGLTGVRAAYAIAPVDSDLAIEQLQALCPSWPIGGHGEAMLAGWVLPDVHNWLAESLVTLQRWKERQIALCERWGWDCLPSQTNFYTAKPNETLSQDMLMLLRNQGIKLRDCTSFGLPGYVRLSVQPPAAQDALVQAMTGFGGQYGG